MSYRQIDCEQALWQLYVYLDRELGDDEQVAMRRHLESCRSCFSRMEFERRLKERLRGLRDEGPSKRVEDRIRKLLQRF